MASAAALVLKLTFVLLLLWLPSAAQPGFLSLDCGGETGEYMDGVGIHWTSDSNFVSGGQTATLPGHQLQKQYRTVRYFPPDKRKYCYTIDARERTRYLVRASFLYGDFDHSPVYPKFDLSLGSTHWSTVVIYDASSVVVEEAIVLAPTPELRICLSEATTGQPFISTLEVRMLGGSAYSTPYEAQFFLSLFARINFGAENNQSIRYPDDPFDRIWESDLGRSDLSDVAGGTKRISTSKSIFVGTQEEPPEKVMQTAVVGQRGYLSYWLAMETFSVNAWAATYFAEIEDLAPNETRNFTSHISGWPGFNDLAIDIAATTHGKYRVYEASYSNLSSLVFSFELEKAKNSSRGPILNAIEIYNYIQITQDGTGGRQPRRRVIVIAACTVAGAILLLGAIGCCLFFTRKKKPSDGACPLPSILQPLLAELGLNGSATARFTLSDIEDATNNFERILGSGGSAKVYHGKLRDGREIAAKVLISNSDKSIKDFLNEIALLSRIHHRQLVNFLGYSQKKGKRILVYEFMENGTLEQHIRGGPDDVKITSWLQRLQIAEDVAKGIEYLHTGCIPAIIHRDIKTSNILLDNSMRGKISDFGISKAMIDGAPKSGRGAPGTVGYVDPEYASYGKPNEKIDIYSFGVVILELISGEKPIPGENSRLSGHGNIVLWARSHMQSGTIDLIIDGSLDIGYNPQSLQKMANLAMRSVEPEGAQRPSICEVLREIQDAIRLEVQLEAPNMEAVDTEIVELEHVPDNCQIFKDMINPANRR
ncbi:probable LRR receptor-like serine/threonine-protein kinase At1g67720 [Lolium rigidum]|uniref:probable LRR receptor-like serine/threonine-protein kinase At1g67720 n=1 Tax=Lolium rigidum TaxID=89674 RepID=UPI001F5C97FB|nr:probable LRR receptor-like serine/threonine-protein kinase At1g67720 [Lolium rigidum]